MSIWRTNSCDDEVREIGPDIPGEQGLIVRQHLEVRLISLDAGAYTFIAALQARSTLAAAATAALAVDPTTSISHALALLIATGEFAISTSSPNPLGDFAMLAAVNRAIAIFSRIPHDLIAVVARIGIGTTFLRAGLLKLEGWSNGNTLALFTDEYKLPLLPPKLAAVMAMSAELTLPLLLFAGLATRFSALAMLAMTL